MATPGLNLGTYMLYTQDGAENVRGTAIYLNLDGGNLTGDLDSKAMDTNLSGTPPYEPDDASHVFVANVGNVSIGLIDTSCYAYYDEGKAGNVQIGSATLRAQEVVIGGIDAGGPTQHQGGGRGGSVTIYASGNVSISNSTALKNIEAFATFGRAAGNIRVDHGGAFAANDLLAHISGDDSGGNGNITLAGDTNGACVVRDIKNYRQSTYWSEDVGAIGISGYTSVSIRDIIGWHDSSKNYQGAPVTISGVTGSIDITGTVDLHADYANANSDGYLDMTCGGTITMPNVDLTKIRFVRFDSDGKSYITGLITGTDGDPASGLGNIGTGLRTPNGQTIYYEPDQNPSLNEQTYTLADLDGTAGAGGELKPVAQGGTVFIIK